MSLPNITESEWAIMETLWTESPLTAAELTNDNINTYYRQKKGFPLLEFGGDKNALIKLCHSFKPMDIAERWGFKLYEAPVN